MQPMHAVKLVSGVCRLFPAIRPITTRPRAEQKMTSIGRVDPPHACTVGLRKLKIFWISERVQLDEYIFNRNRIDGYQHAQQSGLVSLLVIRKVYGAVKGEGSRKYLVRPMIFLPTDH